MKVAPLFQIILEYLADNIDLVEGLKGLPEIVGEQLAAEVLKKQPHKTFKKAAQCVLFFVKAYGEAPLRSLNLNRIDPLTVDTFRCKSEQRERAIRRETLLSLIADSYLTALDLSFCTAIITGESLGIIGQLPRLHTLVMHSVALVDRDIKYLLACASVRKGGIITLQNLDISGNPMISSGVILKILGILRNLQLCALTKPSSTLPVGWEAASSEIFPTVLSKGWLAPYIADGFFLRMTRIDNNPNSFYSRTNCECQRQLCSESKCYRFMIRKRHDLGQPQVQTSITSNKDVSLASENSRNCDKAVKIRRAYSQKEQSLLDFYS